MYCNMYIVQRPVSNVIGMFAQRPVSNVIGMLAQRPVSNVIGMLAQCPASIVIGKWIKPIYHYSNIISQALTNRSINHKWCQLITFKRGIVI